MAASRQLPQTEDGREPDEGLALTMQPPLQSSMMFAESPIPRPGRRVTIGGYSFGDGPDEDTTQLNSQVDRDQEAAEEDEVFRSMIDNADRADGADGAGAAPDDTRARAPVILNEQVAEAEMTQGQTAIILQQFEKMTAMMQSLTQEKAQEKAERAEWERLLEHKINATIIASSGARGTPVAHGPVHPVHHPVHVQQSEAMTLSQSEQLTLAISHMATAIKTNSTKRGDAKTIISKVKNTKNARLTLMEWQLQLDAAQVPREQWVPRVLQEMDKEGNLYAWTTKYRCTDPCQMEDRRYIHNWTWDEFTHALRYRSVGLWEEVDKMELFNNLLEIKCASPGTQTDVEQFISDLTIMQQRCISSGMEKYFSQHFLAQFFFAGLPKHLRVFMNRKRFPGDDQQLRESFDKVILEVTTVLQDSECREAMKDRLTLAKPRIVGGAAVKARPPSNRIGKPTDFITFFRTTSSAQATALALDALVKEQGPQMAYKLAAQKNPQQTGEYVIVTHPDYNFLAGLPERQAVLHIALKWAGKMKTPQPITSAGAPPAKAAMAAATVAAPATAQTPKEAGLEAEITRLRAELSATQSVVSSSAASTLAPSDSVSQIHASAAQVGVIPPISRASPSMIAIAPGFYAQTSITPASAHHHVPPYGGMGGHFSSNMMFLRPGSGFGGTRQVATMDMKPWELQEVLPSDERDSIPDLYHVIQQTNRSVIRIQRAVRSWLVRFSHQANKATAHVRVPKADCSRSAETAEMQESIFQGIDSDFSMITFEEPGDMGGRDQEIYIAPASGSNFSRITFEEPGDMGGRGQAIYITPASGCSICDDEYQARMTISMCGPDVATPTTSHIFPDHHVMGQTQRKQSIRARRNRRVYAALRRARARQLCSQHGGYKSSQVLLIDQGDHYILVHHASSNPIYPIWIPESPPSRDFSGRRTARVIISPRWREAVSTATLDHLPDLNEAFKQHEAVAYARRMRQPRLCLRAYLRELRLRRCSRSTLHQLRASYHSAMWSRFTRGMQGQARELAHIGVRLETTCPPLAQDDGFHTVFPCAHKYLDPAKPTRIYDLLLMITLGLGCLADSPTWMIALGQAGVIAMIIWLSVCILSRWWASIIMIRHRHAVAPGQYVRALVGIALTLPQAYASAEVMVDTVCWHPTATSYASWSSISVALFCIICGWVLGDIIRNRASRIVAHTVYLQGPTDPQRRNVPAIRACAAINFNGEFQGQRLGMLDSGCNSLVMRFDDELRKHMTHWDRNDIARGDAANGSFSTNGTASVGMNLQFNDDSQTSGTVHVTTKITLCDQFQWDLFPTRWFQNLGHSVLFDGIKSASHAQDTGDIEVRLHQLDAHGRRKIGTLKLCHWAGLTFFPFTLVPSDTVYTHAASIEPDRRSKATLTAKWHTIFACSNARRVHAALRRVGVEVFADLHVPCSTCAETKTHMPSRRLYERANVPIAKVRGAHFESADHDLAQAISQLRESNDAVAAQEIRWSTPGAELRDGGNRHAGLASFHGSATRRGQFLHCDTISLGACWKGYREALVLVDDCTHEVFTYAMKNKSGKSVAEALNQHFLRERGSPEGIHYYCHRVELHSDQGSEFINADVQALCKHIGAIQTYSCPGGLGKWQNSICERKIKDLGSIMRTIMFTSCLPPAAAVYAMYQAQDILNDLPTKAHNGLNGHPTSCEGIGLSPRFVAFQSDLDLDHWFAFGSYCAVHLDNDHKVPGDPHRTAANCVYLCKAHHEGSSGHILWDITHQRRLTVPRPTRSQWNFFPLRPMGKRHLSSSFTWEAPDVADETGRNTVVQPFTSAQDDIHIDHDDASVGPVNLSPHVTRHQIMMRKNIGKTIRKIFFISGIRGDTDYFEGKVVSVTANNKYNIMYSDRDSEEISHKEFLIWSKDVTQQIQAKACSIEGQAIPPPRCNCPSREECVHPWGKAYQKSTDSGIGKVRTGDPARPSYIPSNVPPSHDQVDHFAIMAFGDRMTHVDVQTQQSRINTEMLIHAHMARNSKLKKSAYALDPQSIPGCQRSENWESPAQGNSWKASILTEVNNLIKYGVYVVVDASEARDKKIFPSLINFLTKRTKDSTPESEKIDKRKTRICFGGHRCVLGEDYTKVDSYAPVPTWSAIKIQLALTAIHGMKLKAFDACAAYLQTPIDKEMYVRPPPGLMGLLGKDPSAIWKLQKVLYGYPRGAFLWYQKLFTYLKAYGFRTLGNSATFLMLDRRDDPNCPGMILMNVYSDDGLASTSSESLWDKFMVDFKKNFDIEEKDPDYFLGAAIRQTESGSIILDPSKYLREVAAKYDMSQAVTTSLPLPPGSKLYMNDSDDDECTHDETNLYQQMAGSVMYASLLRPSVMYYASQLGKVMSRPNHEHMRKARQVIQYLNSTADEVMTFRPAGCDGWSEADVQLLAFSDSDWACAVDTRRSHGCHVIMLAGAAVAWRSRSHKSVMLSTAGAEYYEASEACREIAYVRSILADYYGTELRPTPLLIDNAAAIAMGQMPQFTEKQKHIPIRICHLKECCTDGMVELWPVSTRNELADIGTKALTQEPFDRLNSVLMGRQHISALLDSDPNFSGKF